MENKVQLNSIKNSRNQVLSNFKEENRLFLAHPKCFVP
jgi:hypothetical protein